MPTLSLGIWHAEVWVLKYRKKGLLLLYQLQSFAPSHHENKSFIECELFGILIHSLWS
jgi:hypothetical protein